MHVGGPTQNDWHKTLISTLFHLLGSQNSGIGKTAKIIDRSLFKLPPSNPMASICSLCAIWLPLYMGIPYLLNIRT